MHDHENLENRLRETQRAERPSAPYEFDKRALRRAKAGSRTSRRADCGPPTRLPSGEWMLRVAFDLPEAMLDALEERAGGDHARMGEVIRAALVEAGIGDPRHVAGICDGSYSDDEMRAKADEDRRRFDALLQEMLLDPQG